LQKNVGFRRTRAAFFSARIYRLIMAVHPRAFWRTASDVLSQEKGASAPPADEPDPTLLASDLDVAPTILVANPVPPRPPPLRSSPSSWRRNALAATVLLGSIAGAFLFLSPPRGWLGRDGQKDGTASAGGDQVPARKAVPPAPTRPMPETPTAGREPPRAVGTTRAKPAAKATTRATSKTRKARYQKRTGRARVRPPADSGVEVQLF
jgi:hypothetical protein